MTRPRTGFPFLDAGLEQPGAVLAFAHRGGAFHPEIEGLENTLAAFEHAVSLGYQYLETDVHATRDGVLLAFHDTVLDRVTESRGSLANLTHDEVASALIRGREEIPTLEGLLENFPDARFNIDIKSGPAVEPLAAAIERTNSHDRVCVGAFSELRLRAFRRLAGARVATASGPVAIAARRFVPGNPVATITTRALGIEGSVLQVPHRRHGITVVTESFVRRAHAAGVPVHVWVVDDPAEMRALLDLGVDGLMTDRTDLLREVLLERGQWMGAAR